MTLSLSETSCSSPFIFRSFSSPGLTGGLLSRILKQPARYRTFDAQPRKHTRPHVQIPAADQMARACADRPRGEEPSRRPAVSTATDIVLNIYLSTFSIGKRLFHHAHKRYAAATRPRSIPRRRLAGPRSARTRRLISSFKRRSRFKPTLHPSTSLFVPEPRRDPQPALSCVRRIDLFQRNSACPNPPDTRRCSCVQYCRNPIHTLY